jgi:hypothetical protein
MTLAIRRLGDSDDSSNDDDGGGGSSSPRDHAGDKLNAG